MKDVPSIKKQKEVIMFQKRKSNIDESQLSHTKYDCQYHIVFIFRRYMNHKKFKIISEIICTNVKI